MKNITRILALVLALVMVIGTFASVSAAGCSRDVIKTGAERLDWTLDELMEKTILAMRECEASVAEEMGAMGF